MQVGQQCGHLLVVKAAGEAWHHATTLQNILPDGLVRGGDAAGEGRAGEETVEVGWDLL